MAQDRAWKCDVCGYVHRGAEPPLECPICGAPRDMFSPLDLGVQASASTTPPAPSVVPEAPAASSAGQRWVCNVCGYVFEGPEPPAVCPDCGVGSEFFERQAGPAPAISAEATSGRSIVIIGAGIAGVTAAEQARASSPTAKITLVSREPGLPYYRLNLTRALAESWTERQLEMHPRSWYSDRGIALVEDEAVVLDREARKVGLRKGGQLGYDALILANGSHAFVPPIPGACREGVHVLRRMRDFQGISALATAGRRAVCLGGGLLGLEIAGGLAKRGLHVSVIESMPWLLPRQLAKPAADLLEGNLRSLGVDVLLSAQVEQIAGDETVRGVQLKDGREVEADVVLLATGIRPNAHLARRAGLAVKSGVVVDDSLRTSDEAIYAIGDVAEHRGIVYGIWPASYAHGVIAGANAAGEARSFAGIPPAMTLKVLSVGIFSVGRFEARDGDLTFEYAAEDRYIRLVAHDGVLVGANLYGDTAAAGAIKTAIEQRAEPRTLEGAVGGVPGAAAFLASVGG